MRIAFDAKRVYQNTTGLGNYSRSLISSLASFYPMHQYLLYAPKLTGLFDAQTIPHTQVKTPNSFLHQKLKSVWRSKWVVKDLLRDKIQIYHGLSHEIPRGIQQTSIKTVVTIHDLIFEKFPAQFSWIDRKIYRQKFFYACKNADRIISVSDQTKNDIIKLYGIDEKKIETTYQSCHDSFYEAVTPMHKRQLQESYALPRDFFLYVGSIIERKNLLKICEAYAMDSAHVFPPLIVVGSGTSYLTKVKEYIQQARLESRILFLSEIRPATSAGNRSLDLSTLYQMAAALIYPSIYEGFGIPVLEAMASGTPVITSNLSCLPEVGGEAALYVDPYATESIFEGMNQVVSDSDFVKEKINLGRIQAEKFRASICAEKVMNIYKSLADV